MKYFLDTNIFLTIFLKRDKKTKYQDCLQLFSLINNQSIKAATSSLIIAEIVWTLKRYYNIPKEEIVKYLKTITVSNIKIVNTIDDSLALDSYQDRSVKFIDAQIASVLEIQNKKWVIVSYDKDFDKLKVKRKEPRKIY